MGISNVRMMPGVDPYDMEDRFVHPKHDNIQQPTIET